MASPAGKEKARQRAQEAMDKIIEDKIGDASQQQLRGLSDGLTDENPAEEVIGPSLHVYRGRSLACLRPADWPRRQAIFLVEEPWFEPLILTVIVANCVTMAWKSPLDPDTGPKAAFIDVRR